jgi:hypothetical protein
MFSNKNTVHEKVEQIEINKKFYIVLRLSQLLRTLIEENFIEDKEGNMNTHLTYSMCNTCI